MPGPQSQRRAGDAEIRRVLRGHRSRPAAILAQDLDRFWGGRSPLLNLSRKRTLITAACCPRKLAASVGQRKTLRLAGAVPPEVWNHLGTRILPKLRSGDDLNVKIDCSVSVDAAQANHLATELRQALTDLGLGEQVRVEPSGA